MVELEVCAAAAEVFVVVTEPAAAARLPRASAVELT